MPEIGCTGRFAGCIAAITVEMRFITFNMSQITYMKTKEHYDNHLGNFYSWMAGNFNELVVNNERFFREYGIRPRANGVAFDLGCGHGPQSIALAKAGFAVRAVDFNRQLLDELALRADDLNIERIKDDILHFLRHTTERAELIVCMGDTLTHLESLADVRSVIKATLNHLESEGKIVFSFRDLTQELRNEERFLAVRSDHTRILTCFLEFFSDYVMTHDLLYENKNGKWIQSISSYPKLRLPASVVAACLEENGIKVKEHKVIQGMIHIIGQRMA
jgi:2-polyprenyl-3-methyl-5-hydroxy-6-metoxy-1,4-benzoquinol methylase